MATNVTNPYTDLHDDESGKMVIASKMGYWDTVWEILNRKPYLVNCIPEERAWAILHQAVWWKHAIAVKKILAVPGCDSELSTKNGLRPLHIDTTAEIQKLLEQHIAQVNGWEETTQGDTVEANKNETLLNDEANDVGAVQNILYYPACNPAVKTAKRSSYGAGKTAAKITVSSDVKAAIGWREKKLQQNYLVEPTYVSIHDSDLILMRYTAQAMEEYRDEICDSNLNTEFLKVFPEMGWFIFDFINSGDTNWKRAKYVVLKEIHGFDANMRDDVSRTTQKDAFYKQLIKCYKNDHIYFQLNTELKEQAVSKQTKNTNFKAYIALVNALLFKNLLNFPVHTKTTYRGARMSNPGIQKYTVGREFAYISYTSSSGTESVAKRFAINCMFIIDNSQRCVWSPKGIADISRYQAEDEYLYPCGAQFRVTDVKKENGMTIIYLKLICKTEPREFLLVVASNLEKKSDEIKESIANLIEKRREFGNRKNQLLRICNEIERNTNYETQIIPNIRKVNLSTNNAFNCTKCRHTCHYPCPETDMERGGCIMSGPIDEQHCKQCPKNCKFVFHKRANYRYIMESTTQTRINQQMKARFDRARIQGETEERRVGAKQRELNTAIQTVKTKLTEWDEMTSQFDERLRQEQATARADSVRMLRRYDNNKALVQTARFQLEEDELI